VVHEARLFHAFVRGSRDSVEVKGGHALTENYSVLSPEVLMRYDGQPLAQRNTQFIKTLLEADAVIVAGQASSHCVKSSIEDLLSETRLKEDGLFNPAAVNRLVTKARTGQELGVKDNMGVAGILSTQLLVDQFIRNFRYDHHAERDTPVRHRQLSVRAER